VNLWFWFMAPGVITIIGMQLYQNSPKIFVLLLTIAGDTVKVKDRQDKDMFVKM